MVLPRTPAESHWQDHEALILYTRQGPSLPPQLESEIRRHENRLPDILKAGGWVYVVMSDEGCVHFGSVVFQSRHVQLLGEPKGTPIIGHCFTTPEARGRGLYRRALASIARHLQSLGYERIIIETFPENAVSRRGIEGAGFTLLHEIRALVLFNTVAFSVMERDGHRRVRSWLI